MKKLALFVVLATIGLCISAQTTITSSSSGAFTAYHNPIKCPIHQVTATGRCLVSITRDVDNYDSQYFELYVPGNTTEISEQLVEISGDKMNIYHSTPAIYRIHLTKYDNGKFETSEGEGCKVTMNPESDEVIDEMIALAEGGAPEKLLNALTKLAIASENISSRRDDDDNEEEYSGNSKKHHYDCTNLDFHWGFNNWGDNPFDGLVGMSDPGYDLRTSFSSYQLSYNYSYVMTEHFNMSIGVGYESDVYKFNTPYVDYSNGAFAAQDIAAANGYYSTRFVTRYVQLPLGIGWRAHADGDGLNLRLYAVPGLGWCGKHTGLKHELHTDGRNPQDQTNLKDAINPYKLDVRLEIHGDFLGMYLQVATLPLFVEGVKIYPIKIGFML